MLHIRHLERRLQEAQARIRQAEQNSEPQGLESAFEEKRALSKEISRLKAEFHHMGKRPN